MKVGRQGSATSEFSIHPHRSLLGAATPKGGDGLPMVSKLVGQQAGRTTGRLTSPATNLASPARLEHATPGLGRRLSDGLPVFSPK
jgi:hypothetical protein